MNPIYLICWCFGYSIKVLRSDAGNQRRSSFMPNKGQCTKKETRGRGTKTYRLVKKHPTTRRSELHAKRSIRSKKPQYKLSKRKSKELPPLKSLRPKFIRANAMRQTHSRV